jgi:DNA (cytosine-5)-methyltransferase 1
MGLPKDYCEGIANTNPTEEELEFWRQTFFVWSGKQKSDNQIRRWLSKPYSDSSCYTMCGNGVVVNCVDWIFDNLTDYDILYRIYH